MKAREFESIFEECLSAHLEGRRSLGESLSLYPSLADELEPLLRTATEVADTLGYYGPSREFQEEVRQRFLAAAAARRRERLGAGGGGGPPRGAARGGGG